MGSWPSGGPRMLYGLAMPADAVKGSVMDDNHAAIA
jgi:hypothetical protein